MNKKKIDVIAPESSQYGVLQHFSKQVYKSLQRLGFSGQLLSYKEYKACPFSLNCDLTLSFNGAPCDESGEFLCDLTSVPHISCLVDPPYHFLELQTSPHILITCDDKTCVDLFRSEKFPHYYFFPHGVEPDLLASKEVHKNYDILFLGTYIDPKKQKEILEKKYPSKISELLKETAQRVLKGEKGHFAEIFLQLFNKSHTDKPIFSLSEAFKDLEIYIKACDRIALLTSIKHCNISIFGNTVSNKGWQEVFSDKKNITISPAVNFTQAIDLMRQSKIVLNSGIKNSFGCHERVFTSLAAGALAVTSSNIFLEQTFANEKSILFYTPENLSSFEDTLHMYLKDDEKLQEVQKKGRDVVMKNHTWDVRLQTLLPQIFTALKEDFF